MAGDMAQPVSNNSDFITLLGIETSCDDTAAAIVRAPLEASAGAGDGEILANIIYNQFADHSAYGGVVPEIAARAHVERIDHIIEQALAQSGCVLSQIDGIAVTAGPGLIGGVMVGLTTAKAMALSHSMALIPVNHLEAHGLTARMVAALDFPYLLLLVSGGHTQLLWVEGVGRYRRLGTTIDDAVGEAFDKTAQLLGLPNPGGPHLERLAKEGDATRFAMPRPLLKRAGCDFSFSGLKTATRHLLDEENVRAADIAACFQAAASAHLTARTERAMALCETFEGSRGEGIASPHLVVAGGVAANETIRDALGGLCHQRGWEMFVPEAKLCTDNGAMIAWTGIEYWRAGMVPDANDALAMQARPRWPLDNNPEGPRHGGGKKGPKV